MNKKIYILLASLPLWMSCANDTNEKKEVVVEDKTENSGIIFNIPSPAEQFEIISSLDGQKDIELVNDASRKYEGSASKALNFGVFTADVAYLTSYKETSKYLNYFSTLEKLSKDLGVTEVFTKELGDLAKNWTGNADSLFKLSDQTYSKSFQKLVDIEKGNELSLMLAGGWIESMYLIFGTSKGFEKSPKIDQIIVDQKLVVENLLDFMLDYQGNSDVNEYIKKLGTILDIYQTLDCKSSETKVVKTNGKISLSGGETCTLNSENFEKLKLEINKLRTEIIK
ncbi:MAG: hypothetical protein V4622_11795 [Bacteroidota bacterium]